MGMFHEGSGMTVVERLTYKRANGIKEGHWSPNKKQELVDALAAYEDTGLTPGQIRQIDRLYAEKCQEVAELRQRDTAILPENIKGNKKDNGRLLFGTCPKCKTRVSNVEGGNYCQNCGQRLKWEEKEKTPEKRQEWKERMLRNFMRKRER